jgi:four helix bundle protein
MGTKYHGFRDLIVFKKSYSFGKDIFELSKSFPQNEQYSLTDQIRRSSRSIATNIGEAWAFRKYPRSFIYKLNVSYGEASETGIWLNFARDHKYLDIETHDHYFNRCEELQKMLRSMINQPMKFCYSRE